MGFECQFGSATGLQPSWIRTFGPVCRLLQTGLLGREAEKIRSIPLQPLWMAFSQSGFIQFAFLALPSRRLRFYLNGSSLETMVGKYSATVG